MANALSRFRDTIGRGTRATFPPAVTSGQARADTPGPMIASGDDGMLSAFRPAQHTKPQQQGYIGRIAQAWNAKVLRKPPASQTTEQGAAAAASPLTYPWSLYSERYERRAKITDVRLAIINDGLARRSTKMYAREAVRHGCTIKVNKRAMRGPTAGIANRAQKVCDEIQEIVNADAFGMAWMLIVEGELFLQWIVAEGRVVGWKRMPAIGMERLCDDADEIIDPARAFSQIDVSTNTDVAYFPLALMHHERWDHIPGMPYGESEIVAGRRYSRLLQLQEEHQVVRRMTRAFNQRVINFGTEAHPTENWQDVENWMTQNGYVKGETPIYSPNNPGRDLVGNGLLKVETVGADQGVSDVGDIQDMRDVYGNSCLPTPLCIMNVMADKVDRDVLEEVMGQWLKGTMTLTDAMKKVIRSGVDLGLLLEGILPESISYDVHYDESTMESASEVVDRIIKERSATVGAGTSAKPSPTLSRSKALQLLAAINDVDDVEAEEAAIDKEMDELLAQAKAQQADMMKARAAMSPAGAASGAQGGKNGYNGNGHKNGGETATTARR